ncbi:MAG TPA: hypothetical protein VKG80_07920 [Trebonia sp.]|nr:hypothetical protein [Trebonia sp.]
MRRERDRYARHPVRHALARGLWRLIVLAALAAVAAALTYGIGRLAGGHL